MSTSVKKNFEHRCDLPRGRRTWECPVCRRTWEPSGSGAWRSEGGVEAEIVAVVVRYSDRSERTFGDQR